MSVKYRKRSVFVIALISLFLYFHIVCFNETVKNAFGYYDGYKSMVFVIDFWIGSACGELYNLEDREKLRFYAKPQFRFFGSILVIAYGLYLVSKAGFLWDIVLFELHAIAFMLIAAIDLWEGSKVKMIQKGYMWHSIVSHFCLFGSPVFYDLLCVL